MDRRGFSIIELIVAVLMLSFVILGVGASASYLLEAASSASVKAEALQAVSGRISQIVADPRYQALDALYEGTETDLPSMPGYSRATVITQTKTTLLGLITDYKEVMVTVTGPGLAVPVSRTMIVGAP